MFTMKAIVYLALIVLANFGVNADRNLPSYGTRTGRGPPKKLTITFEREINYKIRDKTEAISNFGIIRIGSEAQAFKLLFDTTSAITWVPERNGRSELHHAKGYNCSETCSLNGMYVTHYRGIEMVYKAYHDDFSFKATPDAQTYKIKPLFFAVGRADKNDLSDRSFDGVVSMSLSSRKGLNDIVDKILLEILSPDAKNLFAFYFNPRIATGLGGQVTIGGLDSQFNPSNIVYHRTVGPDRWSIRITSVRFTIASPFEYDTEATIDTGTHWMSAPKRALDYIRRATRAKPTNDGKDMWSVDCRGRQNLPSLIFEFGKRPYFIPALSYTVEHTSSSRTTCYLAIKPSLDNKWNLGVSFLQNFYTIFDRDTKEIGFGAI